MADPPLNIIRLDVAAIVRVTPHRSKTAFDAPDVLARLQFFADLLPKSWTISRWNFPIMMLLGAVGKFDEEIQVHGCADRFCPASSIAVMIQVVVWIAPLKESNSAIFRLVT